MTYELPRNVDEDVETTVEELHNRLATEHGRENVLIVVSNGSQIHLSIEAGVGTEDPTDVFTLYLDGQERYDLARSKTVIRDTLSIVPPEEKMAGYGGDIPL